MKNYKPVICTLTKTQLASRGSSWRKIATAASRVQECEGGYVLLFDTDERSLAELVDLVAAEQECCAWMNLNIQRDGSRATLKMTADSIEGTTVIKAMLGM